MNSPGFSASYGYDAAGNRTSAGGVTFTYDAGGRLVSSSDGASYTYDAAGNLFTRTRGGQTDTFVWDGLGRLTRINYADGTHSTYGYDDRGRRVSKRERDGVTIYYTYIGTHLAQEIDSSGAVVASYTYDVLDRPISMWRRDGIGGEQTYYYLLDHLGTVLGLVDESGAAAATYRYDPWGNIISSTGSLANPLRFTAREWDEESRLYFYRARYYDPQVGRFISRDPIGLLGGLNTYGYVHNNTINRKDPLGESDDPTSEEEAGMCAYPDEPSKPDQCSLENRPGKQCRDPNSSLFKDCDTGQTCAEGHVSYGAGERLQTECALAGDSHPVGVEPELDFVHLKTSELQGKLAEKFRQEFFNRGLPCRLSISNFWPCSRFIARHASGLTLKC